MKTKKKRTPSVHGKDNDGGDDCDDNNAHLVNSVMILMMNMTKENYMDVWWLQKWTPSEERQLALGHKTEGGNDEDSKPGDPKSPTGVYVRQSAQAEHFKEEPYY